MAIHQIEGPDGQIHEIEAPDDASPEDIIAFAEQSIQPAKEAPPTNTPKAPSMGQGEAFGASAIEGIPLGTDMASGIAALYAKAFGGIPLKEGYDQARASFHEDQAGAREQFPKTALVGNLTGAVGSSLLVPAAAIRGPTMLVRAGKGAGVGAGFGAAYGFNEGDDLNERAGNAIQQGVVSAPFGALGSVVGDLAVRGGSVALRSGQNLMQGPLAQKTLQYLNRRKLNSGAAQNNGGAGGQSGDDVLRAIRRPLEQKVTPALTSELPIPLTQGQMTQAPKAQALEYGAAAGNYGEEAQKMMLEARELQSDAAKGAIQKAAGAEISSTTGAEAARDVKNILSQSYKSAKAKTRAAYTKVGELQTDAPLKVGADFIKENLTPSIQDWARKGGSGTGFDLNAPGMQYAKSLYNQAVSVSKMDKISSMNFSRMEQWRGRVSQAVADAKAKLPPGVTGNSEVAFLSGMLQRYDDVMNVLPREAIKSGDVAILDALDTARAARSGQGKLFERNKIIMDVLKNDDVSNETLVNILFSGKGRSYNSESSTNLSKIMKAAGDKAPEVLQAAKQGVYSKIMRNSMSAELKAGGEEMVSFDKLATNLKELVNDNPSLFKTLHPDAAERDNVKKVLEAAQRIKSAKPGTRNYSNTAYTLLNWVRSISPTMGRAGIGGANIETALKSMGEGGAIVDLGKALSPVLKDTATSLDGPTYKFFERFAPSAANAASVNKLTIRPAPEDERYPDVVSENYNLHPGGFTAQ